MRLYEDSNLQQILKYIPDLLTAYEKFILAGIELQKLCNDEDDMKDYLYTNKDFDSNKPVNQFFIAAIYKPETFRKETESFIKEIIKASGVDQTDKELIYRFRAFKESWLMFLSELKKIPDANRRELSVYLKSKHKKESTLAEEFRLYEHLWN